ARRAARGCRSRESRPRGRSARRSPRAARSAAPQRSHKAEHRAGESTPPRTLRRAVYPWGSCASSGLSATRRRSKRHKDEKSDSHFWKCVIEHVLTKENLGRERPKT